MRRALLLRAALIVASASVTVPAAAQDADPTRAVFVEVVPQRTTWFVGERVSLLLRVGYDTAFFERSVVQTFRRELDVPLRVSAPWLNRARPYSWRARGAASIAAGDGPLEMERSADGAVERGSRSFALLERRLVLDARDAGDVDLSVTVEFTFATAFRDDFVEGRVARDAHRVRVSLPGPVARVLPLPGEGRPEGFSGGVGAFEIEAHLVSAELTEDGRVAATVRVVLRSEPDTDPDGARFPVLDKRPGLHVLGGRSEYSIRTNDVHRRAWLWELEVGDPSLGAIPPVVFSFFDPLQGGRYVTIETEALELPVRARAEAPRPPAPREPPADDGVSRELLAALAAALLLLAATAALLLRRRRVSPRPRSGPGADPRAAAREGAAAEARAALDGPGADVADVLATFLARRLGCAPAAVVSPDLPRRLEAAGVAPEVAREMSQLLERLVAARYGGAAPTGADRAAILAALTALN